MFTTKPFIELSAILLVGLLVRLYGLSAESLWFDEAFTIKFARLDLYDIFTRRESSPRRVEHLVEYPVIVPIRTVGRRRG